MGALQQDELRIPHPVIEIATVNKNNGIARASRLVEERAAVDGHAASVWYSRSERFPFARGIGFARREKSGREHHRHERRAHAL